MTEYKGHILIVDDMPDNLQYLSRLLNKKGYKVRALPNVKLARQSIESHPPDLILLDIMMPMASGFDLCKMLKSDESTKEIPIIFISGKDDNKSIVKGFKMGGVDYVTKPFNNEEVCARVETHINLIKKNRELEDLISKTLMGSIETIMEIIAFINPDAYRKSKKIGRVIDVLIKEFTLSMAWQVKLAGLLSQIGTISLARINENTDGEGNYMTILKGYDFETAALLVSKIPRMKSVAQIIADSTSEYKHNEERFYDLPALTQSSLILGVINDCYEMLEDHLESQIVFQCIKDRYKTVEDKLIERIIILLDDDASLRVRKIKLFELQVGMVLAENIVTTQNLKLLSKGTELSLNIIHLLKNRAQLEIVKEPITVFVT